MNREDTLKVGGDEKELVNFLERLRSAGELRVELDGNFFRVSLVKETSAKGRGFLTGGGVLDKD